MTPPAGGGEWPPPPPMLLLSALVAPLNLTAERASASATHICGDSEASAAKVAAPVAGAASCLNSLPFFLENDTARRRGDRLSSPPLAPPAAARVRLALRLPARTTVRGTFVGATNLAAARYALLPPSL